MRARMMLPSGRYSSATRQGRHGRLVHSSQILLATDVLLRQAEFRDGHERRKGLGPADGHILHGHPGDIRAELDLDVNS